MKPQTLCLVVLGVIAVAMGLAVPIYCACFVASEMVPAPQPGQPVAFAPQVGGPMFNFGGVADAGGGMPVGAAATKEEVDKIRGPVAATGDCTVSGPYTHANLSVYLIHGPDKMGGQKVMPLQAALAQGLAVVHEGAVSIDNRADVPVFIQAGDIIKGGTQDRTLPYDQLVQPGVNRLPLTAMCVEAGRCFGRANEPSASFESATEQLPGKRLHLAARGRNQGQVWNGVQQVQQALARNVGGSVQSPLSQTSLQLTLESPLVHNAVEKYQVELFGAPLKKNDVIGAAMVVNGEIQAADIYGSTALFQQLWPKLLKANAVAAVAEAKPGGAPQAPSVDRVKRFLADAEKGTNGYQEKSASVVVLRQDSNQALLFDTCDPRRETR